jgi:hypothetical protein
MCGRVRTGQRGIRSRSPFIWPFLRAGFCTEPNVVEFLLKTNQVICCAYFVIARPPSLDDVRSLCTRFIPILRRIKEHLMTLNWNGAPSLLWSYVAQYRDCYVTATRKCFNSLTVFFLT